MNCVFSVYRGVRRYVAGARAAGLFPGKADRMEPALIFNIFTPTLGIVTALDLYTILCLEFDLLRGDNVC